MREACAVSTGSHLISCVLDFAIHHGMHLLVDVGRFFSSQRVVLTILVELSSCNWLVPQSRSGIYLLIVKASVVTAADLAAFKDI